MTAALGGGDPGDALTRCRAGRGAGAAAAGAVMHEARHDGATVAVESGTTTVWTHWGNADGEEVTIRLHPDEASVLGLKLIVAAALTWWTRRAAR